MRWAECFFLKPKYYTILSSQVLGDVNVVSRAFSFPNGPMSATKTFNLLFHDFVRRTSQQAQIYCSDGGTVTGHVSRHDRGSEGSKGGGGSRNCPRRGGIPALLKEQKVSIRVSWEEEARCRGNKPIITQVFLVQGVGGGTGDTFLGFRAGKNVCFAI